MKKLLIAFTLLFAVSIGMYSCNNGAYDAQPDKDNSSALNPINNSSGVTTYLGSMDAIVNKKQQIFDPAFYYKIDEVYYIVARIQHDSILERYLRINFTAYNGPKEYGIAPDAPLPGITFSMIDTTRVDKAGRPIYNVYTPTGGKKNYVNIQGEEGGHLRGVFNASMHRTLPEEVLGDDVMIDSSAFYFEQVPYPIPAEFKKYVPKEHRGNPEE